MHLESRKLGGRARFVAAALLSLFIMGFAGTAWGAEGLVPFDGEKSSWHGFDRYDFLMDETDLTIKPYKVAPDEKNAIKAQVNGQRRCVVVVPKTAASGNPWSWQACYWDHEPQAEVEPLRALADQLTALRASGADALAAYRRNVRLKLFNEASQVILEDRS